MVATSSESSNSKNKGCDDAGGGGDGSSSKEALMDILTETRNVAVQLALEEPEDGVAYGEKKLDVDIEKGDSSSSGRKSKSEATTTSAATPSVVISSDKDFLKDYASAVVGGSEPVSSPAAPPQLRRNGNLTDTAAATATSSATVTARLSTGIPGAFPQPGPGGEPATGAGASSLERQPTQAGAREEGAEETHREGELANNNGNVDDGLAVANLIQDAEEADEDETTELEEATPIHDDDRNKHNRKTRNTYVLFGVLGGALLILILIFLVVALSWNGSKDTTSSTAPAASSLANVTFSGTGSPSSAPTSYQDYLMSLLPETTVQTLLRDDPYYNMTPQGKAYQWLLEDVAFAAQIDDDNDDDDNDDDTELSPQRLRQRYVLTTLYYATNGKHWLTHTNWLNHSVHECFWYTKSDMGMKHRISYLYAEYLQEFNSTQMAQHKCFPQTGLYQHLWLDQNNLKGTIPIELFMVMTSLQTFSIRQNTQLEGSSILPTQIGHLTNLQAYITAGHTARSSSSSSSNQDDNNNNNNVIPSEIGLLTKLRGLGLSENNHQGVIPTELWLLTNLETLFVSRNPKLGGSVPSQIGTFSSLHWLTMDENNLSGTIPTQIGQVTGIDFLTMTNNRLSGTVPSQLGLLSTKALYLSLFGNSFHQTLPTQLGLLSSLLLLNFRSNNITGPIPSELGQLTNLQISLGLRTNYLTGTIPTQLGLLTALLEIEVQNNYITGTIPSQIGQIQHMVHFNVANNSISGTIPTELVNLQYSLYGLGLEGNPFLSGSIPPQLCTFNATCFVGPTNDACEEAFGLSFDCGSGSTSSNSAGRGGTGRLCGCECPCGGGQGESIIPDKN